MIKKLNLSRFTTYITEVDAIDSRTLALAEVLKNQQEAPEPWVLNGIGNILIECVGRRKSAEIHFLGRDPKGLLGVSDALVEGALRRLEVECPDDEDDDEEPIE